MVSSRGSGGSRGSFWDFGSGDEDEDEDDEMSSIASTITTGVSTTTSAATTPTAGGKDGPGAQFLSAAYTGTVGPAVEELARARFEETWMSSTSHTTTHEVIQAIRENLEALDLLTNGESTGLFMESIIENIVNEGEGEGQAE